MPVKLRFAFRHESSGLSKPRLSDDKGVPCAITSTSHRFSTGERESGSDDIYSLAHLLTSAARNKVHTPNKSATVIQLERASLKRGSRAFYAESKKFASSGAIILDSGALSICALHWNGFKI